MKRFLFLIILGGLFQIVDPVFAASNQTFVPCNIDAVKTGESFTKATISITSLDTSGNFIYMGIDAGIFEKPSNYDSGNPQNAEWNMIYMQRVYTNNLNVDITDFGDMSAYKKDKVYTTGYRIIYRPSGPQTNPIVETEWRKVDSGYFKLVSAIEVTEFTDRVTAANSWMKTEEEIQKYNKYFPDSEVVCKFTIKPNIEVDKYKINLDVNSDDIAGIDISYIKIVKIDYDGVTQWGYKDRPGPSGGADKPLCGKYDGSKTISFEIDNPDKKVVTVWCKYKFKNSDMNNIPDEFRNKVEVTAESGGNAKVLEPQYNTIRLRKAKVQYR